MEKSDQRMVLGVFLKNLGKILALIVCFVYFCKE